MKIVHIANLGVGGIGRLVTDLANQQVVKNNKVDIFSPLKCDNYFDKELNPEIKYIQGELTSGFSLNIHEYLKLYKQLRQYDVIHFHLFNPLLLFICSLNSKKIVHTEHGAFNIANQKSSLKNYIKKALLGRVALSLLPDVIVYNSTWMLENSGQKNKRQVIVHNGIVLDKLYKPVSNSPDKCRLLFVGRIEKKKGLIRLLDAVSLINEFSYLLTIVGTGTDIDSSKVYAKNVLPEHSYDFVGQKYNVDDYYRDNQIFLLGSVGEPFGLVVLEALKNGCLPLMYSDAGGAIEIVKGIHDRLVSANNEDMAGNIAYWRNNENERMDVIKLLQEKMLQEFNVETMCDKYTEVYESIL